MSKQHKQTKTVSWRDIQQAAGPYPLEAFNFVREGLTYTAERTHRDLESLPESERHISGQELCLGLRDFAIEQYGLLARLVLDHWHVRRTDDFGRLVFAMIDAGLMTKTESDVPEDFQGVYDFREVFAEDELAARIGLN